MKILALALAVLALIDSVTATVLDLTGHHGTTALFASAFSCAFFSMLAGTRASRKRGRK